MSRVSDHPLLVLAIVSSWWALPAAAQNLLTNPGFDTDLGGWSDYSDPPRYSAAWSGEDATATPSSGSVLLSNDHPEVGIEVIPLTQCVGAVAGEEYALAIQGMVAAGQSRSGAAAAHLVWYRDLDCQTPVLPTFALDLSTSAVGVWTQAAGTALAPATTLGANVYLGVYKSEPGGSLAVHIDDVRLGPAASFTCTPSPTTLCVDRTPGDRRFRVRMHYASSRSGGIEGDGQVIELSSLGVARGGLFWFFNAANPEVLVKVLDGCPVNDHFWVFYSAGTNLGFTLEVLDTVTGQAFSSSNPDFVAAAPVQEVDALPCD